VRNGVLHRTLGLDRSGSKNGSHFGLECAYRRWVGSLYPAQTSNQFFPQSSIAFIVAFIVK
jgi:hypothetical protein